MNLFSSRTPGGNAQPGYSVVDDRLTIRGEIDTDGTVRVDGRVEGATHRAGTLIVGNGGTVVGNIEAREVLVAGTVEGDVHASGRIEIDSGATVHGQISAGSMVLKEGATVHGQVSIGAVPATVATPAAPPRLELAAVVQQGRSRGRGSSE